MKILSRVRDRLPDVRRRRKMQNSTYSGQNRLQSILIGYISFDNFIPFA